MAGLSVLLESQESSQVINKTTIRRRSSPSPSPSPYLPTSAFLETCFLCRKRLSQGQDIYMYRGNRAFCSEECRCRQIWMDEESVRSEKCSFAAATSSETSSSSSSSSSSSDRRNRGAAKSRPVPGGFAY